MIATDALGVEGDLEYYIDIAISLTSAFPSKTAKQTPKKTDRKVD